MNSTFFIKKNYSALIISILTRKRQFLLFYMNITQHLITSVRYANAQLMRKGYCNMHTFIFVFSLFFSASDSIMTGSEGGEGGDDMCKTA